jgi:hypothetical protein
MKIGPNGLFQNCPQDFDFFSIAMGATPLF